MKDPAVLFYTQDFITGTLLMTDEQRGKYILLLCLQHQNGKLTERDMMKICGGKDEDIWAKFYEEDGFYYNKRMLLESNKRKEHCEKQKERIQKYWNDKKYHGNTTVVPLENENENENEDINKDEKKINIAFDVFWNLYAKKVGDKERCRKKWDKLKNDDRQKIIDTLPEFISSIREKQFQPFPETYLNQKRWNDEIILDKHRVEGGYYEE